MGISNRGTGGKRVNRLNLSVTNLDEKNLTLLAISVDTNPGTLAYYLLTKALYDPSIIHYLQETYNLNPQFKILPVVRDGKTEFKIKRESDLDV